MIYQLEADCRAEGYPAVCGVDEAGRGPIAGPVYAAAVILPPDSRLPGLNDSKKLSAKRRDALFPVIQATALAWGIGTASVAEIERLNILEASLLAMRRAVEAMPLSPDMLLIDGNIARGFNRPARAIVGGDARCACIAAASILAKVSRDAYMLEASETYPQYGFEKHKGYGTKLHYQMIDEHGLSPEHRPSFLRKYFA